MTYRTLTFSNEDGWREVGLTYQSEDFAKRQAITYHAQTGECVFVVEDPSGDPIWRAIDGNLQALHR